MKISEHRYVGCSSIPNVGDFFQSHTIKFSINVIYTSHSESRRVPLRSQTRSRSHTREAGFVIGETRSRSQMLRVPPLELPNPVPNPIPTRVPLFRVYPCPGLTMTNRESDLCGLVFLGVMRHSVLCRDSLSMSHFSKTWNKVTHCGTKFLFHAIA